MAPKCVRSSSTLSRRGITTDARAVHTMSIATTIPSHAAWFSLDDVTDLERRALPEYFSPGSELKTSESYKQARNFIVGMYREQPTLYLSLTECRRHLSLDVAAVMRMHQFLEHWGLINYLSQRPHASGAHDSTTVLLDGPASAAVGATAPLARPLALGCGANLSSRANAYRAASGAANGDEKEWTPEATMALLEGLEQFEERWEDVAAHVGRTPEECVRQFLRLPLEEPYQPEPLLGGAIDPQLCQLALLTAAVRGGGGGGDEAGAPGEARNGAAATAGATAAADAAASGLREAARAMLEVVQQRALQQVGDEERQMQRLCAVAVDTQLQRLEAKLQTVEELGGILQREREQIERARAQVFSERLQFERRRLAPPGAPVPTHGVVAASAVPQAQPRTG